jgi:hypothetical protein
MQASLVPDRTSAPAASDERVREVKVMENILANAVGQGASDLAHQMQISDPGSVMSINPARARGIALDGYGVLFDVDVPLMNMSVMWTRRQMLVQNLRDQIADARLAQRQRAVSADDQARLAARIQFLETQLAVLAPSPGPSAASPLQVAQPAPGTVVATTADITQTDPRSTNQMYSDAIKKALMDAMVNHSSALDLTDTEWLTVAARDNSGPTIPGGTNDLSGIILRIRGSDLAAFRANKLSRDEVLTKIEIHEWR